MILVPLFDLTLLVKKSLHPVQELQTDGHSGQQLSPNHQLSM
jgi:hypothetical protein